MSILTAAYAIVVVSLFSASCLALGAVLLRVLGVSCITAHSSCAWRRLDSDNALGVTASSFLIGMTVMGAALTVLGLLGALRPMPIWSVIGVGLLFLPYAKPMLGSCVSALLAIFVQSCRESVALRVLFVGVVVVMIAFAMAALIRPPIGDAEAFYMVYAKVMAASGRLTPMVGTYEQFSSIGLPLELHMAALFSLAGPGASKLIVWPIALCVAALLASIVATCGGGWVARLISVLILLTSSTFTHYIWDGKVDLVAAAFGVAACYWAVTDKHAKSILPIVLAGFFAGAATAAKFSYIISLGASLFVLFIWRWRHGADHPKPWVFVQMAGVGSVAAVVAWIPQLLKNGVLFGAPLAPFVGSPWDSNWLNQVWFSPEATKHILLTYPFALVFGRYPMQGGGLSPLMLSFAPLLLTYGRIDSGARRRELGALTLAGLVGILAWIVLRPSVIAPRYILATLLLLVPIVAVVTENAWRNHVTPVAIRVGVVMSAAIILLASSWHVLPVIRYMLSNGVDQNSPCFLASAYCEPLRQLNGLADPGDRIYFAGYYGFWLRADLLQCRDSRDELYNVMGGVALIENLAQRGFRFAVIERTSHAELFSIFDRAGASEIIHTDTTSVFELTPPESPSSNCLEVTPDRWLINVVEHVK